MLQDEVREAMAVHLPAVLRWAGAIARNLRQFNIALEGKSSGSANTDALTLADLTLQELIVSALRDADPIFRQCRIEGEEETGELKKFAEQSELGIAIDPIDGTRQYRDHTGNGYAVMVHLQSVETVHYSLVFIPETGPQGTWVEVAPGRIVVGDDDTNQTARRVLDQLPAVDAGPDRASKKIYLIGFQDRDPDCAQMVTGAGLEGFTAQQTPGSIYDLMARGDFAGSLIHSPNIYDFPVSLQIARELGGDAIWVHNREPVHFGELWLDDRADMLRLPGIVACSEFPDVLNTLCDLACDWNPRRYVD